MPAPFSPVHVPFVSGIRQDIGKLAQESPAQLRVAQNVVFTKKGHVTGRPGLATRDVSAQQGQGSALTTLAAAISGATPSGLVSAGYTTGGSNTDTPLACWQGQSYFSRAGIWESAGVHWSLRQTKSAALETHDPQGTTAGTRGAQIPVGRHVVGAITTVGGAPGIPFLTDTGEISFTGTAAVGSPSTFDSTNRVRTACAGDAVFWSTAGQVFGYIPTGSGPTTTQITVTTTNGIGLAATTDASGNYYVFSTGGSTQGNVVKISPVGAILQTLAVVFTAGSAANGPVDITYDVTTNRLGLVAGTSGASAVATKILTLVAGVVADAGIDLSLTGGGGFFTEAVVAGTTHNGRMSVVFAQPSILWATGAASGSSGSLYVGGRSFTAAVETAVATFTGSSNSFGFGQTWDPMFAGKAVAGRTLVGIMHGYENTNRSNQWVVLDFTSLYTAANTTERTVVACGALNGSERSIPASVYSDATQVSFGLSEGVLFATTPDTTPSNGTGHVPLVRRAATLRITLAVQGTQGAHVHGNTLLSGQLLHVFDGNKIRPHHFPEEAPYIFDGGNGTTPASAGGSLAAGSYSYQATWEAVNARGQTVRSGASPILVVPGVTINQKVTLNITKPQLWNNASAAEFVRVRLWATQTTSVNNAAKYLAAETVTSTPAIGAFVTLVHSTVAVGNEEQLYETVDTLADMRAPGADRGVAYVNERAWVADQTKLYASKIIRPGLSPSWNTEETNVLTLPASLGTIQGLAGLTQRLVVVCSRGVAVVSGPGVDDTGAGPGWELEAIDGAPGMGEGNPRGLTATPLGVAFQGEDGDVWMVAPGVQATPLSRQVRDSAALVTDRPVDVVSVKSRAGSNPMLVAPGAGGILRVLDLEMAQWGTWTFSEVTPAGGRYFAAVNGSLWMQLDAAPFVASVDGAAGSDLGTSVTATIETGTLRPAQPLAHGWGRLRSVSLNEVRVIDDDQITVGMRVVADANDRVLMNKSGLTFAADALAFPSGADGTRLFKTSVQRCAYVRVILTMTPAKFDAEGLDLWVSNTGEATPLVNRS